MNAAELVAALNTVEQDHRLVLEKMQALKDAVCCLVDPRDGDLRRALDRLRDLNDYFATQFAVHMDEEELTLFPLLGQQRPAGADLVSRLRVEHTEILRKREEFGNCLDVAAGLEDALPRAVVRDLLGYGWELWDLLDTHAHAETRAVHQCVGAAVPGEGGPER